MSTGGGKLDRRRLLDAAAASLAAAWLGIRTAEAAMTETSLAPLKHIATDLLDVAYAEAGPADGPPVLLLPRLAV